VARHQRGLQRRRLSVGQLARVHGQRLHAKKGTESWCKWQIE
jgi:hypothetical protein